MIQPKFKINELVSGKYSQASMGHGFLACYEVIFIHTETCSAGTQIFYSCRLIHYHVDVEHQYNQEKRTTSLIDVSVHTDNSNFPYCRFREDELKSSPDQVIKDVTIGIGMV